MFFYPVRVISRLIQIKTNLTVQPIGKLDMTFFKTILGKEIDEKVIRLNSDIITVVYCNINI